MQRTIPPPPPNNGDPYDADLLIWAFSNAPEGMFGEVTESEREARRKAKAVEAEKRGPSECKKEQHTGVPMTVSCTTSMAYVV